MQSSKIKETDILVAVLSWKTESFCAWVRKKCIVLELEPEKTKDQGADIIKIYKNNPTKKNSHSVTSVGCGLKECKTSTS